ncbi:MAG: hypothetical protein CFH10_00579 [Alphaproteobacteria bacterium MarineAlpha4_Bin2]|nr:MAG: hypothetical protein CFH10_00579 [Alphaproteobacteria bacterium MarineAlpha4_Bin2]
MNSIVVREILPSELALLASLYGECFADSYPEPATYSLLRTPGAWCHIAFGDVDDTPLGFSIGRAILDEAELLSIGALTSARRRGVATALLQANFISAQCMGARMIHLEVGEDNPGAVLLYRKLGFRMTGRRENYYLRANRRRVAAILMTAELSDEN